MLEGATIELLGLFVVTAAALTLLGHRARIPAIVACILAGLLLGPVTGIVAPVGPAREASHLLGQVGIVLLMFVVGLELSLDRIRQVGRVAVVAGLGQIGFTAAGGTLLAWALGQPLVEAAFVGVALTFSSTVVVVKVLDEKKELDTLYGRIAVGIFLVQDIVVIGALTLLAGLDGAALDAGAVAAGVARAFAGMAGLLAVVLLAARHALPRPFAWAGGAPHALLVWSLAWCFVVVTSALTLGLSAEIGGLLAGVSLAQLGPAAELRRRIHPLMTFFVVVFFVSLGVEMPLAGAGGQLVTAFVLSVFVLVGNPLIFIWLIARTGYGARTAFLAGVTVAQISEFSFVFVAMGVAAGLLDPAVLSLVGVVGLVTIVASVFLILHNGALYAMLAPTGVFRLLGADVDAEDEATHGAAVGHVVVVGMNDLGRGIARDLADAGEDVVAIDTDPRKLVGLPCRTLIGDVDHLATLADVSLERARLAVSALRIEDVNQLFAWRCRQLGVPVVVHGYDRGVVEGLRALGPDLVLDSKMEAARRTIEEVERLVRIPT